MLNSLLLAFCTMAAIMISALSSYCLPCRVETEQSHQLVTQFHQAYIAAVDYFDTLKWSDMSVCLRIP